MAQPCIFNVFLFKLRIEDARSALQKRRCYKGGRQVRKSEGIASG
ncbi:MAG: hypothetical protein BSOLF_2203 [Candidatus Carbobacillus altaicus]|uniref:Uncharacterized protein n=1 Tax=Candidatus Carbonibacillus altaicus TaxID=2163959 RepID=A0A2R6XYC7_9BACL|nr:MAG: hypothetical protein BSOLF_2203 [Candidatus Carbobacillus altaicus]